ncbi:MAG: 4-hydroxy-3-methylbut-2-enyl diphosphate reductase [Bacteroidales bacterium]
MIAEVDEKSGFCFGVDLAVKKAEDEIQKSGKVYCLGQIVHNDMEVKRLEKMGMITIDHEQLKKLKNITVLIRAHGEPPETYKIAEENNINIIDASCPIVLKFQKRVIKAQNEDDKGNQVVIYGEKNHPEVIGLSGQIGYKAIIVEKEEDLELIDLKKPVQLFSQTTKPAIKYKKLAETLKDKINSQDQQINLKVNQTTCGQVSGRDDNLIQFSENHDVVIFVGGKKSSNAQTLFNLCKSRNERTYFVSSVEEINKEWFKESDNVGICGATSTPRWLMDDARDYVLGLFSGNN